MSPISGLLLLLLLFVNKINSNTRHYWWVKYWATQLSCKTTSPNIQKYLNYFKSSYHMKFIFSKLLDDFQQKLVPFERKATEFLWTQITPQWRGRILNPVLNFSWTQRRFLFCKCQYSFAVGLSNLVTHCTCTCIILLAVVLCFTFVVLWCFAISYIVFLSLCFWLGKTVYLYYYMISGWTDIRIVLLEACLCFVLFP